MEYLKLIGILIVILGFALKLDSILIIVVAAVVTALVGGLGPVGLCETLGSSFVANRSMAIFILVMLVTGTLERNGLKNAAAALIGKVKNASPGVVIGAYGVMRSVFAAFNVGFGGVAGFVRPIIMPMATGAIEAKGDVPNEEHVEELKGMASGMEKYCVVLLSGIVYRWCRWIAGTVYLRAAGISCGACGSCESGGPGRYLCCDCCDCILCNQG